MKLTRKYKYYPYNDRETRNKFVAQELNEYIGSSVLNIGGGGQKFLKKYLSKKIKYVEVDMCGQPDIFANLECDVPLCLDSSSFETIVCTDVLEHVENLHAVFDDMIRMSSKWIIISLPNPPNLSLSYFTKGSYGDIKNEEHRKSFGRYIKYYGLPYEKPLDRHKWFFGYTEFEDFFNYKAQSKNLEICEIFGIGYYKSGIISSAKRIFVQALFGKEARANLFTTSSWCVLRKK